MRQLGMLAKQRREEIGLSRAALVKEATIESEQDVAGFEFGRSLPSVDVQRKLENALGWRLGIIGEAMRRTGTITMEEVDAEDSLYLAAQPGAPLLSTASDAELLAEVVRRGL